jgi:hypothetical protein
LTVTNALRSLVLAAFALALIVPAPAQQKPDLGKVAGSWALEVNAGGEFYYLTLDLKVTAGKLDGVLGEQNGMFKDVPLANVAFDGTTLKFDVKIPTPPEGTERLVKSEMKLAGPKLEGVMTVVEMGMSVGVSGVKK